MAEAGKVDEKGIPRFALPWLELGRLKERERWQATGASLLEKAVMKEINGMKEDCKGFIPTPTLETAQRMRSFASRKGMERQDSIDIKAILISQLEGSSDKITHILQTFKEFFPTTN